jgi:ATP-dependent DNA helicase DinG
VLAQLVGRWAAYSKDGDMVGGDLPRLASKPVPPGRRGGADRPARRMRLCRLPHYRRCFIERAERASREADLVIANHALVMVNAARAREDAATRILFDEGHHCSSGRFDFARRVGGQDDRAAALDRRPEGKRAAPPRLSARLMDVAPTTRRARWRWRRIEAAGALSRTGWRIGWEGAPFGAVEACSRGAGTVYARAARRRRLRPGNRTGGADPRVVAAAAPALESLQKPLAALARRLEAVLEDAPDWLDSQARARVDGAIRGLSWRRETLRAWIACWRGSAARRTRSSSTGWRSSASTGANMTSPSTAAGSTRPSRWRPR